MPHVKDTRAVRAMELKKRLDCIEGSTYIAVASAADHPVQATTAARRVLTSAAAKIEHTLGVTLEMPA